MKTQEFLSLLKENAGKSLLFEYADGQYVAPNYHITEIKNVTIDAIDCGAGTDFWKETIIQLWESPLEKDKQEYMSAYKALGILNKVDAIKPMEKEVEVKFEYGNSNFHTAQLYVHHVDIQQEQLLMKLGIAKTDCKAKETCGVPEPTTNASTVGCAPGSGCC